MTETLPIDIDTLSPEQQRQLYCALRSKESERSTEEKFEANKDFVGKFFRYRNSYSASCPGWWLYIAVQSMSEYGELQGYQFQTDSLGISTIETSNCIATSLLTNPITKIEFLACQAEFSVTLQSKLVNK